MWSPSVFCQIVEHVVGANVAAQSLAGIEAVAAVWPLGYVAY